MTAPERFADSQIPLAPWAPSIHDPLQPFGEHPAWSTSKRVGHVGADDASIEGGNLAFASSKSQRCPSLSFPPPATLCPPEPPKAKRLRVAVISLSSIFDAA